jgi:hypothetical protein
VLAGSKTFVSGGVVEAGFDNPSMPSSEDVGKGAYFSVTFRTVAGEVGGGRDTST